MTHLKNCEKELKEKFKKKTLEKYGFEISLIQCVNDFYHFRSNIQGVNIRIKNGHQELYDFDKEIFDKFRGGLKPNLCNVSLDEWLDTFDKVWKAGKKDIWTYDIKNYHDAYCYWVTDKGRILPCDFMSHYQTLNEYYNFLKPGYYEEKYEFGFEFERFGNLIIKEKGYCWVRFPSRMGFTELSVRTSENMTKECLESLKTLLKNEAPKYDEWTQSYSLDKKDGFYKLFNFNSLIKELNNS